MRRIVWILITLIVLLSLVFFNLGRCMDVTEEPVKSDIIVCLGGGTIDRVKKSIELLENGFAEKHVLVLIGESWYNQPYIKKNYPKIRITIDESPKNTKEEVFFIKTFMKEYNYKSALIVTDPPHSGRVKLLTSLLSIEDDEDMNFSLISSEVQWWDREYYKNKRSSEAVIHESIRIIYSLIAYGILDKIGLLEEVEEWRKGR